MDEPFGEQTDPRSERNDVLKMKILTRRKAPTSYLPRSEPTVTTCRRYFRNGLRTPTLTECSKLPQITARNSSSISSDPKIVDQQMAIEEPSFEVDAAPEKAEEKPEETKAGTKSRRARKAKEPKPKKAAAPKNPRGPSTHPPWEEVFNDSYCFGGRELITVFWHLIGSKETTGSSQYAIAKFIEAKHKQITGNFKKLLLFYSKRFVAAGKLIKVKTSYKLHPAATSSAPAKKKPAVTKAKYKPASKAKEGKSAKSDSKAPAKTKTASKPKSKPAAKPKATPKAKSAPTKTKAVASVKPNTTAAKPTKAARTSTRASPGKKAAAAPKPSAKKAPAAKKATAKSVKPKTVKSPAKRGRK